MAVDGGDRPARVAYARGVPEPEAPLTLAAFRPLQGEVFTLHADDGTELELTLVEVRALAHGQPGVRAPFALLFRGPGRPVLAQATFRLAHAVLGPRDVFLVPVAADAGGADYEAIFG
jgi:hypothetical protein